MWTNPEAQAQFKAGVGSYFKKLCSGDAYTIGQTTGTVLSFVVNPEDISAAASKASKAESLLGKAGTFSKSIAVSGIENAKNIINLPGRTLKNIKNASVFVCEKLIPASGEAAKGLGKVLQDTGKSFGKVVQNKVENLKILNPQWQVAFAGVAEASAETSGEVNTTFSKVVKDLKSGVGEVKDNFVKAVKSGNGAGKGKFDFAAARQEGIRKIEALGGVDEDTSSMPSRLNPNKINFMQNTISNKTGEYTVLNNAKTFSENPSKIFELEPIKVWKDGNGQIWTLDHRRLGASRIAGLEEVPVQWATKAEVYKDAWKFTNNSGGESIVLKVGDGTKQIIK